MRHKVPLSYARQGVFHTWACPCNSLSRTSGDPCPQSGQQTKGRGQSARECHTSYFAPRTSHFRTVLTGNNWGTTDRFGRAEFEPGRQLIAPGGAAHVREPRLADIVLPQARYRPGTARISSTPPGVDIVSRANFCAGVSRTSPSAVSVHLSNIRR